ncbi:MAG: MBL fold metallo-hydrolase [Clostridia bacterium]|nr:MBL fold metallo-hydrolase [Clostridia bacterium]
MITDLKITILCENTVGVPIGVTGEWGSSILLEVPELTLLFDTGADGALVPNARALGIDLATVDLVVLSHGHYDHTGGLRAFLQYYQRPIPVVAHPEVFSIRFADTETGRRHIGVPFRRQELESLGANFRFATDPLELVDGLFVSGEVPRRSDGEGDQRLVVLEGNRAKPDPFLDDLSIYAITDRGLVIVLGCAHAGVVNIVEHAREVTGVKKVHAVIGGTHLGPINPLQRKYALDYLRSLDLDLLAANHCTGLPVMAAMAGIFGERFRFASVGTVFTLPFGH